MGAVVVMQLRGAGDKSFARLSHKFLHSAINMK